MEFCRDGLYPKASCINVQEAFAFILLRQPKDYRIKVIFLAREP